MVHFSGLTIYFVQSNSHLSFPKPKLINLSFNPSTRPVWSSSSLTQTHSYLSVVAGLCVEADYIFIPEDPPKADWPERLCQQLSQARRSRYTLTKPKTIIHWIHRRLKNYFRDSSVHPFNCFFLLIVCRPFAIKISRLINLPWHNANCKIWLNPPQQISY